MFSPLIFLNRYWIHSTMDTEKLLNGNGVDKIYYPDDRTLPMAIFEFLLFWGPIGFALMVAASYLGTKLALRSYFEGEDPPASPVAIEDESTD